MKLQFENDYAYPSTGGDNLDPLHTKKNFNRNSHELHKMWFTLYTRVQALFYSNLNIVLSILGACNLGPQIKYLYTYVRKI